MDISEFINKFDMLAFCSRFLAGGESLKKHRVVSRKRLLLASSGVTTLDFEAQALHKNSQRFCNAVRTLSSKSKIDTSTLCEFNDLILENKKISGKIRTIQNWFGPSIEKSVFVPPPASEIDALLHKLYIEFDSVKSLAETESIIKIYCSFIKIHPFLDGNGRCARALWLALQNNDNCVPPFIYRLVESNDQAHDYAVRNFSSVNESDYWSKMLQWNEEINQKSRNLLKKRIEEIFSKIPLFMMSSEFYKLMSKLINQPIFDEKKLIMENRFNEITFQDLNNLELLNLIKKKGVRSENKIISEFELLTKLHIDLEKIILGKDLN